MDRRQVLDALNRLAFAAEILDDKRIDAKALAGGAWNLRSLDGDLEEMHRDGTLNGLRNVNKIVKTAVADLYERGHIPLLDELETKIPAGLFAVRRVKGLGPKKVRALWQELDISSLAELEQACRENRLVDLKGFGKKTQEKVQVGVARVRSFEGFARLDVATELSARIRAALLTSSEVTSAEVAGDVRRGKEIASELSFVLAFSTSLSFTSVTTTLAPLLQSMLADEDATEITSASFEAVSTFDNVTTVATSIEGMRVAFHIAPSSAGDVDDDNCRDSATPLLQLFSSASESFLESLRAVAATKSFTLSPTQFLDDTGAAIAVTTEDAIFSKLGLHSIVPERREEHVPMVHVGNARPRLLRRQDLTGALHNHTIASDGGATLEQMRDAAIDLGLQWLGISEHSESAAYAGGLDAGALATQAKKIGALNTDARGALCPLLHGVESDILPDGSLDYDDTTLNNLGHVIASVHARGRLDRAAFTARMVHAAENPFSDVIGHPTGRLLLGRAPSDFDTDAMLDACARTGTSVELNASPARLDLGEELLAQAKERGILVSISADAHSTRALAHLDYGVTIARRAGLTPDDVLNARPLESVLAWFAARRYDAAAC